MASGEERRKMFRLWVREWKDNHLIKDTVIEDSSDDTRTHKVFRALETACVEFDLAVPVWLDATVRDFQRHARARFTRDAFVEKIDFDYLEIYVIEVYEDIEDTTSNKSRIH